MFSANVPYSPLSEINLTVESKASVAGLSKRLELWNRSSGQWDAVAFTSEGVTDSVLETKVTGAGPYTDQSGWIKLKVSWKESGPVPHPNWETSVDYVHYEVVPQFVP